MKNILSHAGVAGLTVWLGLAAGTASAVPVLQLGIAGGTYDGTTGTVVAAGPVFSLYAFLTPNRFNTLTDNYYLSMAISPQVATPVNLGSFTFNSTTVNVTSGMDYGYPPLDTFSGSDPGDLAAHSVFPTYFKEVGFNFSSSNQSGIFNTQDNPSWGPQTGSGMYYNRFDINTSNLVSGYTIHFDLYNTKLCLNGKGPCSGTGDVDVSQFAPFSHDAQSMLTPPPAIPEPETYAMLLAGLGLLGFTARRRKQNT